MLSENSIKNPSDSTNERRLQRAQKHVSEYWFPPNPILVKRIKEGIDQGVYDLDVGFLIAEIKTDFSLLTYCLREVIILLRKDNFEIPPHSSFTQILTLAGLSKIKKVLMVPLGQISSHSTESITEEQALRLQEAMISASTVEVLSEKQNFDSDLGFSCALVRQLGHTLIAWNYTSVYQRCMNSITPSKSLDILLAESLGFSPHMLALAILDEWGIEGEVSNSLNQNNSQQQNSSDKLNRSASILRLCQIGEALARANDPEHYPTASSDWEEVKAEIADSLGYEGIKLVQDRVKQNCENYLSLFPEMFANVVNVNPDSHIHEYLESSLLKNNQFVKHCPPRLRKRFKDFYGMLRPGEIVRDALALLLREIIPFAGFNGGYIFTADPTTLHLIPRTKIGTTLVRSMEPINYNPDQPEADDISAAFICNAPVVQRTINLPKVLSNASGIASIAGSLGNKSKFGVLYLELNEPLLDDSAVNILVHFKAVRQAIADCFQS